MNKTLALSLPCEPTKHLVDKSKFDFRSGDQATEQLHSLASPNNWLNLVSRLETKIRKVVAVVLGHPVEVNGTETDLQCYFILY